MARLRKPSQETKSHANSDGPSKRTRIRNFFDTRRRSQAATPGYAHFASNVRRCRNVNGANLEDTAMISWTTGATAFVIATLLTACFMRYPHTALRLVLFGEMLLCPFPPILANWIVIIPIALPMKVQSRLEVALGLAMLSWMNVIDWSFAWERTGAWIRQRATWKYGD